MAATMVDKLLSVLNAVRLPLGTTIAGVALVLAGWFYVDNNFVHSMQFQQAQQASALRQVEFQLRMLENEIFRLEMLRATTPGKFSAVDAAVLKRLQAQAEELRKDRRTLKR